jgi:Fe-S cluster assembly protein SufD
MTQVCSHKSESSVRENILTEETFNHHLERFNDTLWVQKLKKEYWQKFKDLPMPKRTDESWRFATPSEINLDDYVKTIYPDDSIIEKVSSRSHTIEGNSGKMVFVDNYFVEYEVSEELKAQGVIWESLDNAFKKYPELLKKYFLKESSTLGGDKFLALHAAYCETGAFLYVPKNIVIEKPFIAYHWAYECETALFPHTLIVTEENSKVNHVDLYLSTKPECKAFSCGLETLYAGANSQVFRKNIQNWNSNTFSYQIGENVAYRDSRVKNISVNVGAKKARFENRVKMAEPGADVKLYSLTVAEGNQEFDQRTHQAHIAPNTTSDLLYKNALLDNSHTIFSGMIEVGVDAQQTDAYQTNRNLLLSDQSTADSLPGLNIEANDVKCSHGSTTGQIDQEELFYLLARGIPERQAKQLLVFGFFEEIISKIDNAELQDNIREVIREKFESKINTNE